MKENNYAFIDGNNLYLGAKNQGINVDYRKLRLYLKNKLKVERAFIFVGYDKSRKKMYAMLERSGFELIFKPAVFYTKILPIYEIKDKISREGVRNE